MANDNIAILPPRWADVESSDAWSSSTNEEKEYIRNNWILDMHKAQKAGLVPGTPDDLIQAAKKNGFFGKERTLAMPDASMLAGAFDIGKPLAGPYQTAGAATAEVAKDFATPTWEEIGQARQRQGQAFRYGLESSLQTAREGIGGLGLTALAAIDKAGGLKSVKDIVAPSSEDDTPIRLDDETKARIYEAAIEEPGKAAIEAQKKIPAGGENVLPAAAGGLAGVLATGGYPYAAGATAEAAARGEGRTAGQRLKSAAGEAAFQGAMFGVPGGMTGSTLARALKSGAAVEGLSVGKHLAEGGSLSDLDPYTELVNAGLATALGTGKGQRQLEFEQRAKARADFNDPQIASDAEAFGRTQAGRQFAASKQETIQQTVRPSATEKPVVSPEAAIQAQMLADAEASKEQASKSIRQAVIPEQERLTRERAMAERFAGKRLEAENARKQALAEAENADIESIKKTGRGMALPEPEKVQPIINPEKAQAQAEEATVRGQYKLEREEYSKALRAQAARHKAALDRLDKFAEAGGDPFGPSGTVLMDRITAEKAKLDELKKTEPVLGQPREMEAQRAEETLKPAKASEAYKVRDEEVAKAGEDQAGQEEEYVPGITQSEMKRKSHVDIVRENPEMFPALSHLIENGGIKSKREFIDREKRMGRKQIAGEYDAAENLFSKTGVRSIIRGQNEADVVAGDMLEKGIISRFSDGTTTDAMMEKLNAEVELLESFRKEKVQDIIKSRQDLQFSRDAYGKNSEDRTPIQGSSLGEGDKVIIGDQELSVSVDQNGEIILKDGKKYGEQVIHPDDSIKVDDVRRVEDAEGGIQEPVAGRDVVADERPADADLAIERQQKGFGLETQTEQEVLAERKKMAEDAKKKVQADKIKAIQEKPIKGTRNDFAEPVLFADQNDPYGGENLFSGASYETKVQQKLGTDKEVAQSLSDKERSKSPADHPADEVEENKLIPPDHPKQEELTELMPTPEGMKVQPLKSRGGSKKHGFSVFPGAELLRQGLMRASAKAKELRSFFGSKTIPNLEKAGVLKEAQEHASAYIDAPIIADAMLSRVFTGERYKKPEVMQKLVDWLNWNDVLGGYDDVLSSAKRALIDGDMRKYDSAMKKVAAIETAIVDKGYTLQERDSYVRNQIEDAQFKADVERWKEHVSKPLDQLYHEVKRMDKDTPYDGRGRYMDTRINLLVNKDVESIREAHAFDFKNPGGHRLNPDVRRDRFDKHAKFTGDYSTNARDVILASLGPRLNEATKMRLYDKLISEGHAVWSDTVSGPVKEIRGEPAVHTTVKMPFTDETGKTVHRMVGMWIQQSLKRELMDVLNTDMRGNSYMIPRLINEIQIKSGLDYIIHSNNQIGVLQNALGSTSEGKDLMRQLPLIGKADAIVKMKRTVHEALNDTSAHREKMARLAEYGLVRAQSEGEAGTGKLITIQDNALRVILNEHFDSLVARGAAKDTPEERIRFVTQAGEYNRRLLSTFPKTLRDWGLSPFVVAGRAMNRASRLAAFGDPGFKSPTITQDMKNRAIKLVGPMFAFAITPSVANMFFTGSPFGRPGTMLGQIDTGKDDSNGNHIIIDIAQIMGMRRGVRNTGVQATVEGLRNGMTLDQISKQAMLDVSRGVSHPFLGPAAKIGYESATGRSADIEGRRVSKDVEGGASQLAQNIKGAVKETLPIPYGLASSAAKVVSGEGAAKGLGETLKEGVVKPVGALLGVKSGTRPQTSAMAMASEIIRRNKDYNPIDDESREVMKLKAEVIAKLKDKEKNIEGRKEIASLVRDGTISPTKARSWYLEATQGPLAAMVKQLSLEDAKKVESLATKEEKASIEKMMREKERNAKKTQSERKRFSIRGK